MKPGNHTRLFMNEVATRDGFQNESLFVPTPDKIALVDRLSCLGYARIEVTSFTSVNTNMNMRLSARLLEK